MLLNTIIVEDELLARDLLKRWLNEHSNIHLQGEAGCLDSAKQLLKQHTVDLIFLDINLLGENGFCLLDHIAADSNSARQPEVIFVTAYADYAVQAFRVNAVDYLHKPFSREQLDESITRVLQRLSIQQSSTHSNHQPRIAVKDNGVTNYLETHQVQWAESAGGYTMLHTNEKQHIMRISLQHLLVQLGDRFKRVHRSHIVNIDYIASIKTLQHGDAMIYLSNGTKVRLSRRYRQVLKHLSAPTFADKCE